MQIHLKHQPAGLIDEIMSKDKHIRYEELCNAVRPVWFNISITLVELHGGHFTVLFHVPLLFFAALA